MEKTLIFPYFRENFPFRLAAGTTKHENNFTLAGERSSVNQWCHEPG